MNELRQVTFGRRKHPITADVSPPTRKPWLALVLAALVVTILAALAAPLLQRRPVADRAEIFLAFSAQNPELVRLHVLNSIEPCLSEGARAYWSDPAVQTFAGDVLFKALSLKYSDLTSEQRDAQFREWIGPASRNLTPEQQMQFRGLMANGLHQGETGECLAAKVHTLAQS